MWAVLVCSTNLSNWKFINVHLHLLWRRLRKMVPNNRALCEINRFKLPYDEAKISTGTCTLVWKLFCKENCPWTHMNNYEKSSSQIVSHFYACWLNVSEEVVIEEQNKFMMYDHCRRWIRSRKCHYGRSCVFMCILSGLCISPTHCSSISSLSFCGFITQNAFQLFHVKYFLSTDFDVIISSIVCKCYIDSHVSGSVESEWKRMRRTH